MVFNYFPCAATGGSRCCAVCIWYLPNGLKYQVAKGSGEVEVGAGEGDGCPTQVVGLGGEVATLVEVASEGNRTVEYGRLDAQE